MQVHNIKFRGKPVKWNRAETSVRTDRWTDMDVLGALHDYANAPTNRPTFVVFIRVTQHICRIKEKWAAVKVKNRALYLGNTMLCKREGSPYTFWKECTYYFTIIRMNKRDNVTFCGKKNYISVHPVRSRCTSLVFCAVFRTEWIALRRFVSYFEPWHLKYQWWRTTASVLCTSLPINTTPFHPTTPRQRKDVPR